MNHTNNDDDMEARNDPVGYVTFYHRKYRIPRYYFHYNKLFVEYGYYPEKMRYRNIAKAYRTLHTRNTLEVGSNIYIMEDT